MLNCAIISHTKELALNAVSKHPDFLSILVGENPEITSFEDRRRMMAISMPALWNDNIENMPSLLAFTGWYHLAKNIFKTYKNSYVGIFEYDVEIKKNIWELDQYTNGNRIICFESKPTLHPIFLQDVAGLYEATKEVYKLDMKYFENIMYQNLDHQWGITSNCIMPVEFLKGFVDWYMKLVPHILKYDNHPHFHERAIKLYAILHNHEIIYKPDYLVHLQSNSHGYNLK